MKKKLFLLNLIFLVSSPAVAFLDVFKWKERNLEKCGYEVTTFFGKQYYGTKRGSKLSKDIDKSINNAKSLYPKYSRQTHITLQNGTDHHFVGVQAAYYSEGNLMAVFDCYSLNALIEDRPRNNGKYVGFDCDHVEDPNLPSGWTWYISSFFFKAVDLYELAKDSDSCL
jgi:hypothetical protein